MIVVHLYERHADPEKLLIKLSFRWISCEIAQSFHLTDKPVGVVRKLSHRFGWELAANVMHLLFSFSKNNSQYETISDSQPSLFIRLYVKILLLGFIIIIL